MKVTKSDKTQERQIVTAMIVDDAALARIAAHWPLDAGRGLFSNKWSNLVGGWCVRHCTRYERAPGKKIEAIYERWAAKSKDENSVKLVEAFLSGLSGEYKAIKKEQNTGYNVDQAAEYFNRVRMEKNANDILRLIENGDDAAARLKYAEFAPVELGVGAGVDILRDKEAIKSAFTGASENLIEYPGALGRFFKNELVRDAFVALMAGEKKAKSFWLLDMAWRAMTQKRRVAFFQIGDLSQNQQMRRFGIRAAKRPLKPTNRGEPILYPIGIEIPPKSKFAVPEFRKGTFRKMLDWKFVLKQNRKVLGDMDSPDCFLKLSCHPNGSLGVPGIRGILQTWERTGWHPDIIVIDYADLLSPFTRGEPRDQINESWKALRSLSQAYHCLVVTATQANAAAEFAETLDATHFSEDKRKKAHVTALIGISQTKKEKRVQVCRLNWINSRDSDFDTSIPCHVAGCLAVANPAVKSMFS